MHLIREKIVEYIRATDKLMWFCCFAVSALGCVLLWGILETGYQYTLGISYRNLAVQAAAIGLGAVAALAVSLIDYRKLKKLWIVHVPLIYLTVLLTFLVGTGAAERPDDKRWLVIPGIDIWFQPAELLKISFILVFAYHIVCTAEQMNRPHHVLLLALHAAAPVVLIHFQGDDGTALLIGVIAATMLLVAGLSWKYIVAALAAGTAMLPVLWSYVLSDFQKQRILALLNQETADTQGWYYQQFRAKVAIAMGGDTGVGLFADHVYVPEMHTDFIFSFHCESFGIMGALGLLLIVALLAFKLLHNSSRAIDSFGTLICAGVFAMILFQVVVNVGMCLSLIPVIGNPFPFLSYGGSSMVTNFLGLGLAQSVHMTRDTGLFS